MKINPDGQLTTLMMQGVDPKISKNYFIDNNLNIYKKTLKNRIYVFFHKDEFDKNKVVEAIGKQDFTKLKIDTIGKGQFTNIVGNLDKIEKKLTKGMNQEEYKRVDDLFKKSIGCSKAKASGVIDAHKEMHFKS